MKDYNVVIGEQNFFDRPVRNDLITYDSIWKITTGPEDDCTTCSLLYYNHFKKYYKVIAIDLS